MRIGTWNVEYGVGAEKNARRLRRLREMNCDVWVLTETHDDLDLGADYQAVSTTPRPNKRAGSRWTTIWSRLPIVKSVAVEDLNRTVAVLLESPVGPLIVFGTVLPWNTDRGANGLGKGWSEFYRVAPLQSQEWAKLAATNPGVALCVAGDLNMNLGGPHYYGSAKGRELLRVGLKEAALVCVTESDRMPRGLLMHGPIDHICLSASIAPHTSVVNAWEGTDGDGVRLSDHSGLVVAVNTFIAVV